MPAFRLSRSKQYAFEGKHERQRRLTVGRFFSERRDKRSSAPSGIHAGRQRGIGNDTSVPNGVDEVVFANDALPVSDQVIKQIEHLRCDNNHIRCAVQFAPVGVQCVILKEITQAAILFGVNSEAQERKE
jgi:hypothetical protein